MAKAVLNLAFKPRLMLWLAVAMTVNHGLRGMKSQPDNTAAAANDREPLLQPEDHQSVAYSGKLEASAVACKVHADTAVQCRQTPAGTAGWCNSAHTGCDGILVTTQANCSCIKLYSR